MSWYSKSYDENLLIIPDWAIGTTRKAIEKTLSNIESCTTGYSVRFPEFTDLTKEQRNELMQRGWRFDVDRMGKPMLAISQEAPRELLRRKVIQKYKKDNS